MTFIIFTSPWADGKGREKTRPLRNICTSPAHFCKGPRRPVSLRLLPLQELWGSTSRSRPPSSCFPNARRVHILTTMSHPVLHNPVLEVCLTDLRKNNFLEKSGCRRGFVMLGYLRVRLGQRRVRSPNGDSRIGLIARTHTQITSYFLFKRNKILRNIKWLKL